MPLRIYCLLAILWPVIYSYAQTPSQPIKPLAIGDAVPNITFTNLMNYPSKTAKISDFRGSLVIMDFWATWCSSCIKKFPELLRIQQKFGRKVQVMLVDSDTMRDDREKEINFLTNWSKRNATPFTLTHLLARDNPQLLHLFPHKTIPHLVWIGSDGRVLQTTAASYLTDEYVLKALNHQPFDAVQKADLMDVNKARPLASGQTPAIDHSLLYRSSFYRYLGLNSGESFITDTVNKTITRRSQNLPIVNLYLIALPILNGGFDRRLLLEVRDSAQFILGSQQEAAWRKYNSYTYEITTADSILEERVKQWMLEDLDRFFNLKSRNETRKVTAWELYCADTTVLKTKGGNPQYELGAGASSLHLRNESFERLVFFLTTLVQTEPMAPIVDMTGIHGSIDVDLTIHGKPGFSELQALLKPLGLQLRKTQRELAMHVISER